MHKSIQIQPEHSMKAIPPQTQYLGRYLCSSRMQQPHKVVAWHPRTFLVEGNDSTRTGNDTTTELRK